MKKLLALLLVLAMTFGLAACGQESAQPSAAPSQSSDPAAEQTGDAEHEPVTLRTYVRYSDDDTILPYDYAVECLKEDMPWVTLELEAMPPMTASSSSPWLRPATFRTFSPSRALTS